MAKWADYLISKVEYNAAETHIVRVLRHLDNGDTVGAGEEVTRERVVDDLDNNVTYMTIVWDDIAKTWRRGASVRTVVIARHSYIRTDADATTEDNLGSLPTF